jgi:hypothetical protein
MNPNKDYYKILGIGKDAQKEEIKAAYRKLAMKYHPDRNPGDTESEEKFKEINEAYEILSNDINRHVYDEYRKGEEKTRFAEAEETPAKETKNTTTKNKRTYERKTTVRTERKIYIKGTIAVKYWAEQENENFLSVLKEVVYRLNPVSAEAIIAVSDIHAFDPPLHFQRAYSQVDLFKSPLPQPVKCKVTTSAAEELYDLRLEEIRIVDPVLTDVNKHEKQSLGTLTGDFFAYVLRIDEKEVSETVTECFGETGRVETKTENSSDFIRKEYYHKDCTVFWSQWEQIKKPTTGRTYKKTMGTTTANLIAREGCAQWWWMPFLFLGIIIWPKFFLGLLVLGLGLLILSLGITLLARFIPFLLLLFISFSIYAAFKSSSERNPIVKRDQRPSSDSVRTTKDPATVDTTNGDKPDTLINQFITWKDYDSTAYSIILSVLANDVKSSAFTHDNIELTSISTTLNPVYDYLERTDQPRMERAYSAFDSIKKANNLTETAFAKMVVSCIQSIPYYLVLDQSCNADNYNDEFVYRYLEECNRDCCIGNEKFGIRSPVEFISDLKGDCDTRALVIYSILKKFNYKIALISSEYYKHAMVAISFENEDGINGLSMNINNRNYYLWETTSAGFQPGQVPVANSNLSYWDIALLNEN